MVQPIADGLDLAQEIDQRAFATAYASDGTVILENELQRTVQDNAVRDVSHAQFAGGNHQRATIERIDSRDSEGNWTRKTILSDHKPIAEVYRTITYYDR